MHKIILLTSAFTMAIWAWNGQANAQHTEDELKTLIVQVLREHPEILIDALVALQAEQEAALEAAQQEREKLDALVRNDSQHPVTGNPDGDVTIVFFTDRNCTNCARAQRTLNEVIEADPLLRVITHEWPVQGDTSRLAALAALAADEQNLHDAFQRRLLDHTGPITMETIVTTAIQINLDLNTLVRDLENPAIMARLTRTEEIAQSLDLESAPTFVIGDLIAAGTPTREQIETLIREQREATR